MNNNFDLLTLTGALLIPGSNAPAITINDGGGNTLASYTIATFASSGLDNTSFGSFNAPAGYTVNVHDTSITLDQTITELTSGDGTWRERRRGQPLGPARTATARTGPASPTASAIPDTLPGPSPPLATEPPAGPAPWSLPTGTRPSARSSTPPT